MENRRKFLKILAFILIGLLPVILLFGFYEIAQNKKNGFVRLLKSKNLQLDTILNLKYSGYYFAGKSGAKMYLAHLQAPAHILEYSEIENTIKNIEFTIPLDTLSPINWKAITVKVDSPAVYFIYGPAGFSYKSKMSSNSQINKIQITSYSFDRFQVIDSTYIIRKYDPDYKQNILAKVNHDSLFSEFILPKQIDGVFCTDGMLLKNKENKIIYIYYYRNRFDIFDTSLNIQHKVKTIDTNSQVQIDLKIINDSTQITYSKPPLRVNKKAFLSNQILYVNSALKADNENLKDFNGNSVIDQYQISDGSYLKSFYIPTYNGQRGNDFEILNDQIMVLYKEVLVIYYFE